MLVLVLKLLAYFIVGSEPGRGHYQNCRPEPEPHHNDAASQNYAMYSNGSIIAQIGIVSPLKRI
jgi:hypothetical protein